jgi:putative exporter of polyketide antibiotics
MANYNVAKQKQKASKKTKSTNNGWNFPLDKGNLIIIGVGVGVILLGYLLMMTGMTEQPAIPDGKWNNFWAITAAPIILLLGYCVIIPFGILRSFVFKPKKAE